MCRLNLRARKYVLHYVATCKVTKLGLDAIISTLGKTVFELSSTHGDDSRTQTSSSHAKGDSAVLLITSRTTF